MFFNDKCDGFLTKLTEERWEMREEENHDDDGAGGSFIGVELCLTYVKR